MLLHAPASWDPGALSTSVRVARRKSSVPADVVIAFYGTLAALRRESASLGDAITPHGMAWVAWPRKAAGHASDLSDGAVRETLAPVGLLDVKVAMLDDDWSGLKFMWRLERRAARR